jgi:hypothetical protein
MSGFIRTCTISNGAITACGPYPDTRLPLYANLGGIAIVGSTAYILTENSIMACTISNGAITSCGTPYTQPNAFNAPSGLAIVDSTAYITNIVNYSGGNGSITACRISNGIITSCSIPYTQQNTFNAPYGIAIKDSTAYIANSGRNSTDGSITACTISNGAITACGTPYSSNSFNFPTDIAIV